MDAELIPPTAPDDDPLERLQKRGSQGLGGEPFGEAFSSTEDWKTFEGVPLSVSCPVWQAGEDLNIGTVLAEMRQKARTMALSSQTRGIIIDFSRINRQLSAEVLHHLFQLNRTLPVPIALVGVTAAVEEALKLKRLDLVFAIYTSLQEAEAALLESCDRKKQGEEPLQV